VVRTYLAIAGPYTLSASLIWGVNTPLLDAGLEIGEVFLANAVFAGSMALFEIPTGVLADTRGRRASLFAQRSYPVCGHAGVRCHSAVGGDLLGQGLPWVTGVIAALVSLSTVAGNVLVDWFSSHCARRTTLLLWATGVDALMTISVGLAIPSGWQWR
jgi:hypothetical protein